MLLTIKRFLEMFTPRQQLLPRSTIVYRNFTGLSSKIVWFFFLGQRERERELVFHNKEYYQYYSIKMAGRNWGR